LSASPLIFDGHNDTVLSLMETGRSFFERSEEGHVDLPRAREGGLGGGFCAVFMRDPTVTREPEPEDEDAAEPPPNAGGYVHANPPLAPDYARSITLAALGRLLRIARESNGAVRVVRTAGEVEAALADGAFAMELHLEGAEPIDAELESLPVFHAAGVRSIGIVWSRPNLFGHGVPFAFPSSPDTGPGLTDAGLALVRACNELGILVDVSHLNEGGFWDVARHSGYPIVATHAAAHALCPSSRNLTDKQLDAIRDSDGIVGVNFHVGFLRADGQSDAATTSLSLIADHLDYIAERIGIERVAFGSDFDGATMPGDLRDAAGLPRLMDELRRRGYDDAALTQIAHGNWLRVFQATWGE
jgi:membrane dipeptidase